MRISEIDKEYTKTEAIADNTYIAVDSEAKGTGKMKVSELGVNELNPVELVKISDFNALALRVAALESKLQNS